MEQGTRHFVRIVIKKPSCILTAFIPNVFTTQHSIALKLCFDLEIGVQQRSLKTNRIVINGNHNQLSEHGSP